MKKSLAAVALALSGLVACDLLAPAAPAQALSSFGSSGSSGPTRGGTAAPATPWADRISEGLEVTLIGDLLGPGISDHVGVQAGDLGAMAGVGDDGEFAIIFGDSFRGRYLGQGEWMSPVGVVATRGDDGRIEILRPLNEGDRVEQLIDYAHHNGRTLLPSDIINIDGTLYMQAMWNEGVGNVLWTEIYRSTDNGETWQSVATTPADYQGGKLNLITWEQGPDGYIYQMSSNFQRRDDVYLTRFLPADIGNRSAWRHYNPRTGTWGTRMVPVLDDKVKAGEMSLRHIEGHWVLAMFNRETMAIEVRIAEDIARDWNSITPANVVVAGHGGWGAAQDENNFTQLYGGYITPGSTIADMDLVVSQWNTTTNRRYMSTQFNVKGLDTFFGIGHPTPTTRTFSVPADATGDQSVVEVAETAAVPETVEEQALEKAMQESTDFVVVPLDGN